MKIYKNAWFTKFARKEDMTNAALLDAIDRAERGLADADLGGGVLKLRIARQGAASRRDFVRLYFSGPVKGPCSHLDLPRTIRQT